MVVNPNDAIRDLILRYFYDRNVAATSRFGKKGSAIKISDVKRELKATHGLTQPQVMSNLTYLVDRGWVKTVDQEKTVQTSRGTVPSVVTFYEVSAHGIDKIEGKSDFERADRFPGINIAATGSNVITLGDGNIVQVKYEALFEKLSALQAAIVSSDLDEPDKLDVSIDIATMKEQLAKPAPDRAIVERLWLRISRLADVSSLAMLVAGLAPDIQRILEIVT